MTTIKLEDWKGYELHELFSDYVKASQAEAKATVARRTGSLAESVVTSKIDDGFKVYINPRHLAILSGVREYYAYKYHEQGYRSKPAHPFLHEAFETVRLGEQVSGTWSARGRRARNATGRAVLYGRDVASVNDWLRGKKGQAVRLARRVSR